MVRPAHVGKGGPSLLLQTTVLSGPRMYYVVDAVIFPPPPLSLFRECVAVCTFLVGFELLCAGREKGGTCVFKNDPKHVAAGCWRGGLEGVV